MFALSEGRVLNSNFWRDPCRGAQSPDHERFSKNLLHCEICSKSTENIGFLMKQWGENHRCMQYSVLELAFQQDHIKKNNSPVSLLQGVKWQMTLRK